MPISDPRDRFFYPHHTHMKDTYYIMPVQRDRASFPVRSIVHSLKLTDLLYVHSLSITYLYICCRRGHTHSLRNSYSYCRLSNQLQDLQIQLKLVLLNTNFSKYHLTSLSKNIIWTYFLSLFFNSCYLKVRVFWDQKIDFEISVV